MLYAKKATVLLAKWTMKFILGLSARVVKILKMWYFLIFEGKTII